MLRVSRFLAFIVCIYDLFFIWSIIHIRPICRNTKLTHILFGKALKINDIWFFRKYKINLTINSFNLLIDLSEACIICLKIYHSVLSFHRYFFKRLAFANTGTWRKEGKNYWAKIFMLRWIYCVCFHIKRSRQHRLSRTKYQILNSFEHRKGWITR